MGPSSEPTVEAGCSSDEPPSEGGDCRPAGSMARAAPCDAARSEAATALPGPPVMRLMLGMGASNTACESGVAAADRAQVKGVCPSGLR